MKTAYTLPPTRPLKVFVIDPQLVNRDGNRDSVAIDYEPLKPGPIGDRIAVIDYDGANKLFYDPVNLDDPAVLMQGGLDHSEADPHFHQQMVYAVAMRTLLYFDRALGRRLSLWRSKDKPKLRILPHAFNGANAFYDPDLHAVLFGYFQADPEDPGDNLPSQIIFTCLSHDIIAHEVTHALIHRLRPHFLEATNVDILAFHEGFADLIALFQHFTHRTTLRIQIERTRGNLSAPSMLSDLAIQFGEATRRGGALRSALQNPDTRLSPKIVEPHQRGGILVAAVFDAFNKTFAEQAAPFIRLATGGSGVLPPGELHPSLIDQLVILAAKLADAALMMIIRAFDYMPPMDMTFGDFLRALVTSDMNISPEDCYGLRAAMIEGFRARAIYPAGVLSLAEESLAYPLDDQVAEQLPLTAKVLDWLNYETIHSGLLAAEKRHGRASGDKTSNHSDLEQYGVLQKAAAMVFDSFAVRNAAALGLDPELPISVRSFHRVSRVSPSGRILNEIVMRFEQQSTAHGDDPRLGGLPLRGGCTVIAGADGTIRYVIGKPMPVPIPAPVAADATPPVDPPPTQIKPAAEPGPPSGEPSTPGEARFAAMVGFVAQADFSDARRAYADLNKDTKRMLDRASLRGLHEEQGL